MREGEGGERGVRKDKKYVFIREVLEKAASGSRCKQMDDIKISIKERFVKM